VHLADVFGGNNMLMPKVCKDFCKNFCKFLQHLFYFILHVRAALLTYFSTHKYNFTYDSFTAGLPSSILTNNKNNPLGNSLFPQL